jgi:hypothetical protein
LPNRVALGFAVHLQFGVELAGGCQIIGDVFLGVAHEFDERLHRQVLCE